MINGVEVNLQHALWWANVRNGVSEPSSHATDLAEPLRDTRIIIMSALACREMTAIDAKHWNFTFTTRTGDYRERLTRTVSAQDHETNHTPILNGQPDWQVGDIFSVGDCQIWDLNNYQGCSQKNYFYQEDVTP